MAAGQSAGVLWPLASRPQHPAAANEREGSLSACWRRWRQLVPTADLRR